MLLFGLLGENRCPVVIMVGRAQLVTILMLVKGKKTQEL